LEVRDDGPGFSAEAIRAGHGLDTLQSRLAALFSGQGSLEIQADGRQTAVAITLPR
jgi:signal transduction histidine kinase